MQTRAQAMNENTRLASAFVSPGARGISLSSSPWLCNIVHVSLTRLKQGAQTWQNKHMCGKAAFFSGSLIVDTRFDHLLCQVIRTLTWQKGDNTHALYDCILLLHLNHPKSIVHFSTLLGVIWPQTIKTLHYIHTASCTVMPALGSICMIHAQCLTFAGFEMDTLEAKTSLRMQCRIAFERLTSHRQKEVHACQCVSAHASSHDVISADFGFCLCLRFVLEDV